MLAAAINEWNENPLQNQGNVEDGSFLIMMYSVESLLKSQQSHTHARLTEWRWTW